MTLTPTINDTETRLRRVKYEVSQNVPGDSNGFLVIFLLTDASIYGLFSCKMSSNFGRQIVWVILCPVFVFITLTSVLSISSVHYISVLYRVRMSSFTVTIDVLVQN